MDLYYILEQTINIFVVEANNNNSTTNNNSLLTPTLYFSIFYS